MDLDTAPALAPAIAEHSLDPEDWTGMRALGHQVMDDMLDYLEGVRERPAWQPMPGEVVERLREDVPERGEGAEAAYRAFRELVLPYPVGNIHPRFWGRVMGTGTAFGMMAELMAAAMNTNASGLANAASHVEAQVLEWFRALFGFPEGASGIMLSGASAANLVGLATARTARADGDVIRGGIRVLGRRPVVYCSEETHNSIDRAVVLLGIGRDFLRRIPTDDQFRIRLDLLEQAIRDDVLVGLQPLCIVGNAGTVATGATDDLEALAELAARFGAWFHVDGAFGALAALSPELRGQVAGLSRADSLAFDMHKWLYMPYEAAAVIIRDREAHHRTFALSAAYLGRAERGAEADEFRFNEYGPQLSRSFRALKVWLSLREHGTERYARQIEQNVAQASYLAELAWDHPELELLAPAPLNIVCFRYRGRGIPEERLDGLNAELLMRLQERGIAVPTTGRVRGRFAIRVANTNHRSRREDFQLLAESVVAIGREITDEMELAG
jgi:aromatic-L-amino-acid/L-tryptophan decarboxylase